MSKKPAQKQAESPQNEAKELWKMRHSCEHVLHQTMIRLYPQFKEAMGPATDEGFYIDFDADLSGKPGRALKITEADFPRIEAEMAKIIQDDLPIKRGELSFVQAKKVFQSNLYKRELLADIKKRGEKATVYRTGKEFISLCAGPHVSSTGKIGAFKLLSVAGAYWRGSEKNKMLTRIYGTCFANKKELDLFLWQQEEAKKRDHRKLGQELDLFAFSDFVGGGLPLFTPKGALVRRLINEYVEEMQSKEDYTQVWTPQITKGELFKTSGHYDKYKNDMFRVTSNYSQEEFFLKPMNCPQHTQIYASRPRSYKDLPIRLTDFAMLYRDEKPGELSGLARVRSFSQDDCHIFCREDQVDEEIDKALAMIKKILGTFGFKYRYRLSTRDLKHPEKYIGDPKTWNKVEKWAEEIMKRNKIDYFDGPGEAAFYAPKMDLMATDALGREWQLSTVQIDYFMPERFKLSYIDKDGKEKRPIMLHRAILGSSERFMMVLIEHFIGAFPVWLSPVQAQVIPVADRHLDYARKVVQAIKDANIRVELRDEQETVSKKIRNGELQKVPYLLVVGDREIQANTVSVRQRQKGDLGAIKLETFIEKITKEIINKTIG